MNDLWKFVVMLAAVTVIVCQLFSVLPERRAPLTVVMPRGASGRSWFAPVYGVFDGDRKLLSVFSTEFRYGHRARKAPPRPSLCHWHLYL